jgi:ATP-dependent protease HslVU (ClpYQ) peptidase subunit
MTTIVYKNGIMAADTQETWDGRARRCTKLYKVGDSIIGTAGDSFTGMLFVDWFSRGRADDDVPDLTHLDADEDFYCLVWFKEKLWVVNRLFRMVEVELDDYPYYAVGSGADVAHGALAMGASAKRAVEVAADFDIHTGLPVEVRKCKGRED